nr:collagen alpha-1(I) chain-like [Taeniopygia guttata]
MPTSWRPRPKKRLRHRMDKTAGVKGSRRGQGSTDPTEISNGAHRGPSNTPRVRDGDNVQPPSAPTQDRGPRSPQHRPIPSPPRSPAGPGPGEPPAPARPRGRSTPERGATAQGRRRPGRHRAPRPGTSRSCPSPCSPRAAGRGGGSRPPRRVVQEQGPPRPPPAAGPGRAGQPVPARRGRARALRGRRSPRPVRVPGAARPRAGRGCQRRGGAGRCGAGLAGHHGGCGGLRACGPQCRGRGPVTNLRPPRRAVPLDVPHGAGEAPRPPPRSAARPAGHRAGGGSGPGGSPSGSVAGAGATRPPGLGRRVRVLSAGRPRCGRVHPPCRGRARRWAPGEGYRAEGNGARGSGASGTGAEDSRAGDIGTAGNGAACAALAVRCPSGSARCRAPGAARAWSERPPPLPPPPPSFSSPPVRSERRSPVREPVPRRGVGRACVCVRGVCALGSPRAEPLRSVRCRTPGAAASRPPPLPGPRRARSPLPLSPRSLPRSLPAPARSLSGPAPPRGPGRAARRDPQSAGRLGGSRPRRTDYGSRQPCLLRRRRCRRTAARSARGPTRRLGQGPAPARRPPPPARLGKQVRTHRPAPPRAGPRPPLPGHPGPAPPRTHGTRGQAGGKRVARPPSRPSGRDLHGNGPGTPPGAAVGRRGGGVCGLGGTGDVLRRDSGGGAAGTDSAGRGAAGGGDGSAPRPATARRSRCPARHGCSGSGTGGTCRCRGGAGGPAAGRGGRAARRSRGGGGTAAPGARGVWRRGPSPPRPPPCPGPVRLRVPAGRVPGGGGRALPGGSAVAATSVSGAAPVRQRGGPAAAAGAAGRSAGERPRGQLLSRGLRERARGSTAGPSPRQGCGVRGEAPGAAARPPRPGQGGAARPAGPRRRRGAVGRAVASRGSGRDVPRLGRGARRGTPADPDPGRAAAGAGAVPLRADAPRRPGRGGGGGRSPARAHGDGRAAAGPGEGGGASCRPHRGGNQPSRGSVPAEWSLEPQQILEGEE